MLKAILSATALLLLSGTGEEHIRAKVPQFSPAPGTFTASVTVSVSTYSTGARVYCTSDGSTPRPQASLLYTAPLTFGATTTLKCRTYRSDREPSPITSGVYSVTPSGGYQTPLQAYNAATAMCAALPLRTTGHAVHYFCDCATGAQAGCVAGNDNFPANNDCHTETTPCRSYTLAVSRFNAMPAGDTVAFCKGGAWSVTAETHYHNASCTATSGADLTNDANTGSVCDLRDYSPTTFAGTAKPRIISSTAYPMGWFYITSGNDNGVRVLNLDISGTGASNGGRGIYLEPARPISDWLICNNTFRDVTIGVYLTPFYAYLGQNIRILGNYFYLNGLDSFLGGGFNTGFEANYVLDSGWAPVSGNPHAIYPQGAGTTFTIKNNRFIDSTAHPCGYAGLLAHHAVDGMLIEGNYFDGSTSATGNCWAFSFASGSYGVPEHLNNMVIRGNWIQNFGYYGLYVGMAPDVVIENNVLVENISVGTTGGITITDAFNDGDDATTTRAIIRNNTVYFAAGSPGSEAAAISLGNTGNAPGTGHVVANNSVYLGAGGTCYGTYVGNANIAFMNNNQCYGGSYWEKDNAGSRSLATWRTYSGFDGVSITTAPLYTNPPTDFMPQAGSPLINAGSNTYKATTDFFGITRSSPPDIGAVER